MGDDPRGWVPLHRKSTRSGVWKRGTPGEWKLWCWLLLEAEFQGDDSGTLTVSQTEIARSLGVKRQTIGRQIRSLIAFGSIEIDRPRGSRGPFRITIRGFRRYRSEEALRGAFVASEDPVKNGTGEHSESPDSYVRSGDQRYVRSGDQRYVRSGDQQNPVNDPRCSIRGPTYVRSGDQQLLLQKTLKTEEGATPPSQQKEKTKTKPRKTKRDTTPPTPSRPPVIHRLIAGYTELVVELRGHRPTWNGKTAGQAKALTAAHPVAEILRRARIMLELERAGGLEFPRPPYDLGTLLAHLDKFATSPSERVDPGDPYALEARREAARQRQRAEAPATPEPDAAELEATLEAARRRYLRGP